MKREHSDPPRILIIDDDEFVSLLYKVELEEEGYGVTVASRARKGLELIASDPPNIVVLDLKMPDMDGVDALQKIAGIEPSIPVIINSAYSHLKDNFHTCSPVSYVTKSSDLTELKQKIREVLDLFPETSAAQQAAG